MEDVRIACCSSSKKQLNREDLGVFLAGEILFYYFSPEHSADLNKLFLRWREISRVVYRRCAPIQYMSEIGVISATERSEAAEPQTAPRLVRGPAGGATGGETFHAIWLHFPSKSGNNIDYRIVE